MSRIPRLTPPDLDQVQQRVYDNLIAGKRSRSAGRRGLTNSDGSLVGPFNAWLFSPEIGDRVQRLGAALRFESGLSDRLTEIAILLTARHWQAQFEWWAHARLAERAGVPAHVIDAIRRGDPPQLRHEQEVAVYDFCKELLEDRRVSDETFERTSGQLGLPALVDLVCLCGYYGLVSMTLNAFDVPLPPGQDSPFPPTGKAR